MALKKNDFIEIEFTGKTSEGEIFDSNIKEDLKKTNLDVQAKPFVYALDTGMFLKSVDEFLIGKEPGKYKIELDAENAFGVRNPDLIQLMPAKIFREQNLNPVQGAMFNFDGRIGKVLSNSGGRIRVDFNNPLAGKDVVYDINVKRIIDDQNEKVRAFNEFIFRKDFDFEIQKDSLIMKVEKKLVDFVKLFQDKFKEVLNLNLEVIEKPEISNPKKLMKESEQIVEESSEKGVNVKIE